MPLWLVTVGMQGPPRSRRIDDGPCPGIQAHGIGGVAQNQWWIEESDVDPLLGLTEPEARAIANAVTRANRLV